MELKKYELLNKLEAEYQLGVFMPDDIKILAGCFKNADKSLYLVGGCIRDTFLGLVPKDFDVCTNALPDEVIAILYKNKIEYKVQGEHFGVVVAYMDQGEYEIATFRVDLTEGRKPEVRVGATMEEDAQRRDFTINALYMDVFKCEIIDLVGGIKDLQDKIVRCVGDPVLRFTEDKLRKLRFVRFVTRLGFDVDKATGDAIVADPSLNEVSRERIADSVKGEFIRSYKGAKSPLMLRMILDITKLAHQIFPDFKLCMDYETKDYPKFGTLHMFMAMYVKHDGDLKKQLVKLGFETRLSAGVDFLVMLSYALEMAAEFGDEFNPLPFYSKRDGNDVTDEEILIYNNESAHAKAFVQWKPSHDVDQLMEDGYSKKALGDKIAELSAASYKKIAHELSEQISQGT